MRFLNWLYAKLTGKTWEKCRRCGKMFGEHEAKGTFVTSFGCAGEDDEFPGEFVEGAPTCCGPDEVANYIKEFWPMEARA